LAGVERARNRVTEPYFKLEKKLLILENVWKTVDILRHISRIQIASKRLVSQLNRDADDLVKLSTIIKELGW